MGRKLTKKEVKDIGLPKWPAILVKGKRVSVQQAASVIVRTSGMYFHSNTHDFDRALYRAMGVPVKDDDHGCYRVGETLEYHDAWERYKMVEDLEYLANRQIVSSYIGGPHGWMNWDGSVGTVPPFNIGKYPTATCVLEEWQRIAEAFPFLELECQLFDKEECEDDPSPVIEYRVYKGEAEARSIDKAMTLIPAPMDFTRRLLNPLAECGCTIKQFEQALKWIDMEQELANKAANGF